MTDSWPIRQFSQSNPAGDAQGDVPGLLRRVAASIEALADAEVQDIVFRHEDDDDGRPRPTMTVYFHRAGDD